ncbi:hypothetical protein FE275_00270, partial [Pseudomonas koreensis]
LTACHPPLSPQSLFPYSDTSGLARECGGSVDGDVGCHDAFASKPAPTGLIGGLKIAAGR